MLPVRPGVYFHRLADSDLKQASAWYRRQSTRAANNFRFRVDAALQLILANPSIGTSIHVDYRWVKVRRFPYLIFYRQLGPASVFVIAIGHGHRKPGYWLRRRLHP